jgi:hypothetical protein
MEAISMTTNKATPESDETGQSGSADAPEADEVLVPDTQDSFLIASPDTTQSDALAELDELLSKLDNPELVSVRRLFNMC